LRVFDLPEILSALDRDEVLAAIEDAFRRLHLGQARVAAVGHLGFVDPPGTCHVKGGYLDGDDVFVFKIATSFYRNPIHGLSSSNGSMLVVSARTGEQLALLHDEGQLTDERTALAGAIAARAIARTDTKVLGVVGTGIQARMQARAIAEALGIEDLLIWGRDRKRAQMLAGETGGRVVGLADLCAGADLIVTTTPSTVPLLSETMVRPGTRIVAVGADAPGKQELTTALTSSACIVVDSPVQCVAHGEAGWAVRAKLVAEDALIPLGDLLIAPRAFGPEEIVVADLTGVAIQDVAIAKSVWARLAAREPGR